MPVRLGLCLAPGRVVAAAVHTGVRGARVLGTVSRAVEPPAPDGSWPALAEAVAEAAHTLRVPAGPVSVALLPPLASARVVAVPPLPARELQALVQRAVRRYFLVVPDGALVVDAAVTAGAGRAVVACASEGAVSGVVAALATAHRRVGALVPSCVALAAAAEALLPTSGAPVAVAVSVPGWIELVVAARGGVEFALDLSGLTPAAACAAMAPAAAPTASPNGDATPPDADRPTAGVPDPAARSAAHALTLGEHADSLLVALAGRVLPAVVLPAESPLRLAEVLAAAGSVLAAGQGPRLLPAPQRAAAAARARRCTVRLASGAVAAFVLAAAAHGWGMRRELEAARAGRRAIAGRVAQARAVRATAEAARASLGAVAELERGQAQWGATLAALGAALPDSAYLVSVALHGGQLRLSGVAVAGHAVVPALAAEPRFADVTLSAPLRRESADALDRFDVELALRGFGVPATAPAPRRPAARPRGAL